MAGPLVLMRHECQRPGASDMGKGASANCPIQKMQMCSQATWQQWKGRALAIKPRKGMEIGAGVGFPGLLQPGCWWRFLWSTKMSTSHTKASGDASLTFPQGSNWGSNSLVYSEWPTEWSQKVPYSTALRAPFAQGTSIRAPNPPLVGNKPHLLKRGFTSKEEPCNHSDKAQSGSSYRVLTWSLGPIGVGNAFGGADLSCDHRGGLTARQKSRGSAE